MGFIKPSSGSGEGGGSLTPQQESRLNSAYSHAKSNHAPLTSEENVQPDWNETDKNSDAYIRNKPTISNNGYGLTQVEPTELDMPRVFFYGDAFPTTKDNVLMTMEYISSTDKFSAYLNIKCQGTSSMTYNKKNFTINMYSDEERTIKLKKNFKDWGEQSKFCLKANYTDTTHTRNLAGARIGYDMVNSRPNSEFKTNLLTAPRNGLVDGFPIKVYFNGSFYGIYTWNIPKDKWTFNMDDVNPNHCVLCGEKNSYEHGDSSCNFRQLWTNEDGVDWSVEVGTLTDEIRASFNNAISHVLNTTDDEFKSNISNYFDLNSLIDYFCFTLLCCHMDGMGKNLLMVTYDGVHWGASLYDMDALFGAYPQGNYMATNFWLTNTGWREPRSLLFERLEKCFINEIKSRYAELRKGALSLGNIVKHVEEIYDIIPDRVFGDERAVWTSLPQVSANTMTRFRNYMRDRAVWADNYVNNMTITEAIPCTGITLNQSSIELNNTTNTATLTATITPDNCTDVISWTTNNDSVATVSNGVVTALSSGNATITATCGGYSATCAVTVNIAEVPVDPSNIIASLGYVSDNSILCFDGIQNTANGHSSTAWEDLSNSGNYIDFEDMQSSNNGTYVINDDSLEVTKAGLQLVSGKKIQEKTTNFTIEVAVFFPSNLNTQSWIVSTRPGTVYPGESVGGKFIQLLYTSDADYANDMLFVAVPDSSQIKIGNSGVNVLGAFHTYQYTYDGTTLSQYVDGNHINDVSMSMSEGVILDGRLRLFSWHGSANYSCAPGTKLHAVRIYNTNLSSSQLLANATTDQQRFNSAI